MLPRDTAQRKETSERLVALAEQFETRVPPMVPLLAELIAI